MNRRIKSATKNVTPLKNRPKPKISKIVTKSEHKRISKALTSQKGLKNKKTKSTFFRFLATTLIIVFSVIAILYLLCKLRIFCLFIERAPQRVTQIKKTQLLTLENTKLSITEGNTIDLSHLVQEYYAGYGIKLQNNTFSLEKSGVLPGTYGQKGYLPTLTVDEYGRITNISQIPFNEFVTPPICEDKQKLKWNGTNFECIEDYNTDLLANTTCDNGNMLIYGSNGWECQPYDYTLIHDTDNDTSVTTKKSLDEDIIRFTTNGQEHMALFNNGNLLISNDTSTITDSDSLGSFSGLLFNTNKNSLLIGQTTNTWDVNNIGNYTFSIGSNLVTNSDYAIAFGNNNSASNIHAIAGGSDSQANAPYSMAIGIGTRANAYASIALGRYNVGLGDPTRWNPDDPIFEIGMGTSPWRRNNAFTVLKKGYVGIGTNNPQYPLEVADRQNPWVVSINLNNGASAAYMAFRGGSNKQPRARFAIGNRYLGNNITNAGIWITPDVDRFYHKHVFFELMTNSNIYDYNTKRFLVMQRANGFAEIQSRSYIGNGRGTDIVIWSRPNNNQLYLKNSNGYVGIRTNNPTQTLQVGNSGDGSSAVANAWNTFSDARLKKDIKPIKNAFNIIERIRGVLFRWKKTSKESIGFIAQELEPVLPELVTKGSDGYLSVDYSRITPILVQAIKELNNKFEKQINKLNTELNSLKHTIDKIDKAFNIQQHTLTIKLKTTVKNLKTTILHVTTLHVNNILIHNENISGTATIPAGQTYLNIKFTKTLAITPTVLVTPFEFVSYKIANVTKTGFTIYIQQASNKPVSFNWIAIQNFGQKHSIATIPTISTNMQQTPKITPSPTQVPTQTPTPTITQNEAPNTTPSPTPTPTASITPTTTK